MNTKTLRSVVLLAVAGFPCLFSSMACAKEKKETKISVGPKVLVKSSPNEPLLFPEWIPLINVRTFGAVGDGKTDDTDAIQRAIQSKKGSRQLYFPAGNYLVSGPLVSLNSEGVGQAWLQLYGSGKGCTTIRLTDGATDFQDGNKPVALIQFRAAREPVNGNMLERPNVAFFNSIYDMTIDVGANNPGAVGIDWIVCNSGSLRHVNVVSSDIEGRGYAGVRMNENDGTSFIRDLSITGFDYGWWRGANAQSLAVEGLHLKNQRKAGIFNRDSVFAIRDLTSDNRVPTLIQATGTAQASILKARISGKAPAVFVQTDPSAMLYLRDVEAVGADVMVKSDGLALKERQLTGEWFSHPAASDGKAESLKLEIKVAPEFHNNDASTWALDSQFSDDGSGDYSVRLQKAIDSGAETIVMDGKGSEKYRTPVVVRGNVKRITGFWKFVNYAKDATYALPWNPLRSIDMPDQDVQNPGKFFMRIADTTSNLLIIERFAHFPGGILNDSAKTLVLRDMMVPAYANTPKATGDLFTEGAMGSMWRIGYGQHAWIRSTDCVFVKGPDFRVTGATAWIMSNRSEGGGVFVEAENSNVEIISTSQFIGSHGMGDDLAYRLRNSNFSLTNFSETGFVSQGVYKTLLNDTNAGRNTVIDRKDKGVFKRNNLNRIMFYRSTQTTNPTN